MKIVRSGITRTVLLCGRWAVKFPKRTYLVRGWLANRSEWKQRGRPDVARPVLTLGHFALIMPRAAETWPDYYRFDPETLTPEEDAAQGDECKGSSWGRFGEEWLLIDYDRAWEDPRGLVGALYWGRQERLARKWMRLPQESPRNSPS